MAFPQSSALALLRRARDAGRLAHAYLISGPVGSGKRALAEDLAALVIDAAGQPPLQHPDVHIAEPESKSRRILTEQLRALEKELQMRPTRAGKKVGIIFDADRMQNQAANAFLKTLEEPPGNSLLLLTSAQPELLPDTIISRCIAVPLSAVPGGEPSALQKQLIAALREFFQSSRAKAGSGAGAADIAATYRLVRKFTLLLQSAREEIVQANAAELKAEETRYKQTTDAQWLDAREDHFKALTESRYLEQRAQIVDTLLQWWADILRQQHGCRALDLPGCAADTAALASAFSTAEALRRVAHLEELRDNFNTNVKEDLALEVAFLHAFA